jgi:hypothetical protein
MNSRIRKPVLHFPRFLHPHAITPSGHGIAGIVDYWLAQGEINEY